jgi:hypothetical protein
MYILKSVDDGFCRAYYKKDGKLYCIQDDTTFGRVKYMFCICTSDGEPIHEIPMPKLSEFTLVPDEFEGAPIDDRIYSVATYLCDRAFGGPEEGGWYYDCGEPIANRDVPMPVFVEGKKEAIRKRDEMKKLIAASGINEGRYEKSSVLSQGIYEAHYCLGFPMHFPLERPRYE